MDNNKPGSRFNNKIKLISLLSVLFFSTNTLSALSAPTAKQTPPLTVKEKQLPPSLKKDDSKTETMETSKTYNPSSWGGTCKVGIDQSPINIEKSAIIPVDIKEGLSISYGLINNLTVNREDIPMKIMSKEASSSVIKFLGKDYYFVQFHLHTPAEHQLDSENFPAEIHFVNQGEGGNLTVLSVLVKIGEFNPILQEIIKDYPDDLKTNNINNTISNNVSNNIGNNISNNINNNMGNIKNENSNNNADDEEEQFLEIKDQSSKENTIPDQQLFNFDLSKLLPSNLKDYFYYIGSLTTPPCTEGVNWVVFHEPISASKDQLDELQNMLGKTNRPIQPLNSKMILQEAQ